MNVFMIASGSMLKRRQDLLDYIDTLPSIINWLATDGVVLVATDLTLQNVAGAIRAKFPDLFFLCVEVTKDTAQGWSQRRTWDFITYPGPPVPGNNLLPAPSPPKS